MMIMTMMMWKQKQKAWTKKEVNRGNRYCHIKVTVNGTISFNNSEVNIGSVYIFIRIKSFEKVSNWITEGSNTCNVCLRENCVFWGMSNNVHDREGNENDDGDEYIIDSNKYAYNRPNQIQAACMFQCINSSYSNTWTVHKYLVVHIVELVSYQLIHWYNQEHEWSQM